MTEVLLLGNPNSGKTTLFNAITGATARVGNYPGVTVERRAGKVDLPRGGEVQVVDLPGLYSLSARSPEEQIAANGILGRPTRSAAAVVVVDATALVRGLYVALQVLETGLPTVIALTMADDARKLGVTISTSRLSERLGAPVVELVATRGEGLEELRGALGRVVENAKQESGTNALLFEVPLEASLRDDVEKIERALDASWPTEDPRLRRARALWALLSLGEDELLDVPGEVRQAVTQVRTDALQTRRDPDLEVIGARYAHLEEVVAEAVQSPQGSRRTWTEGLDRVLLHPVSGFIVFALTMGLVFDALFRWSEPLIALIESGVSGSQSLLQDLIPSGPFQDLVVHGIVAGVGNVLVFVPQIALLFLFLGFLEDSGYLARVAFVLDRLMRGVGLHGKAFVPMLSGFACAVPAVLATRTLETRRDRLLTMLVLPLTSCSARLPVYTLLTAVVFVPSGGQAGVNSGAVALFALYALSTAGALLAAFVLRRTVLRGPRAALVLELPPYRLPTLRNLLTSTWRRVRTFLVDAGTIILALTIILWALVSYPRSEAVTADFEARREAVTRTVSGAARDDRLAELAQREAGAQLEHSFAGRVGRWLEPALAPMGQDWRMGVGIIGAFAAREVFVSTLGIVFGLGDVSEESRPLRKLLRQARWPDGRRLLTPLSGVALMVFFVFACQCMSTVAVVRRESGSWRWPLFMFGYMTILAYVAALLVYQVGSALGWGL